MIFTNRDKLTVLELDTDDDVVSVEQITNLLLQRPTNMIYVEYKGKFRGIISSGDIERSDAGIITINRNCTSLHGFEYIKAREIFNSKRSINSLPIIDECNRLQGDYARWDDAICTPQLSMYCSNEESIDFFNKIQNVALVEPADIFTLKNKILLAWNAFFENKGITADIITHSSINNAWNKYDLILFSDEDEYRGINTLYKQCYKIYPIRTKTYLSMSNEISNMATDMIVSMIFSKYMSEGVYVSTIQVIENWNQLMDEIYNRWRAINRIPSPILPEEFFEEFYEELYTPDYANKNKTYPFHIIQSRTICVLADCVSKYYNVANGERRTVNQPEEYEKTIYFFGPCIMIGSLNEDARTIESYLQNMLNESGIKVKVVNLGCWSEEMPLLQRICNTKFKKGDIVIVYFNEKSFTNIPNINLADVIKRRNIPAKWYCDSPAHFNHKVSEIYAQEIFDQLHDEICRDIPPEERTDVDMPEGILIEAYIKRYFADFKPLSNVGAIVMNCNPFTLGHRYLIEQARKQVDQLIIFVVEADKSLFTFRERFAMVMEGTKDISGVIVVPSGNFILSETTFPEYFIKVEDGDIEKNTEYDITLFADKIAPRLGITKRFVGEEKTDAVTNAYNNAMKKILPQHGIEVIEIPRKKLSDGDEAPISATSVRKLLEIYDHTDDSIVIEQIPESTRKLLVQSWG